jgi:hypothetical protein
MPRLNPTDNRKAGAVWRPVRFRAFGTVNTPSNSCAASGVIFWIASSSWPVSRKRCFCACLIMNGTCYRKRLNHARGGQLTFRNPRDSVLHGYDRFGLRASVSRNAVPQAGANVLAVPLPRKHVAVNR